MSEKQSQISFCDDHPDEVAQAICKYHKKLLCISCVLEKAKSSECSIIEIRKISCKQDTALHEGLLVRQIAFNKKRLIEDHENKTEELKNTLKKQITSFHEQLITSFNKMKDDCLSVLEKHAETIVEQNKHSKQQVDSFVKEIDENLEKFSDESGFVLSGIQQRFNEVKETLVKEFSDFDSLLEGKFEEDEYLKYTLSTTKITLGKVYLIAQERYAQVENEIDPDAEKQRKDTANKDLTQDSGYTKKEVYSSSEEVTYITKTPKQNDAFAEPSKLHQGIDEKKQEPKFDKESKKVRKAQNLKAAKKRGFFDWFQSKAPDSEEKGKETEIDEQSKDVHGSSATETLEQNVKEIIYQNTSYDTIENNQLRSLINNTVSIGGMHHHFTSACNFSKLVYLGSGYLGLLSRAHDLVVLTSIDGAFHAKTKLSGPSDMVACGREQIATVKIVDKNLQVIKYKVGNKTFEPTGSFYINVDVPKVTGFDFDVASLKFAISSPGKLAVFKNVTIEKETKYPIGTTAVSDDIVTVYDFPNDCLYLLDYQNRSLKCYSFSKIGYLWKIRIDGQHVARNFCLYEDKLCITNGKAVGLFHARNGKALLKHDTCDLLDDCDGICVIDGVIVFSSNSSDFDTSTRLAFISM